jgi:hypothetical protein
MKSFFTHAMCFIVGFCLSAFLLLQLSKVSSLLWQNDLKVTATYQLQLQGASAARDKDWTSVQFAFQAAENLQSEIQPREWGFMRPVYAWSTTGLISYAKDSFWMINTSIIAYSLERQGKAEEAESIYKGLMKKYPAKDRSYFQAVAQQSLAALDK